MQKEIGKMTLDEISEEICSAKENITAIKNDFLEILYEIDSDLIRGITDSKFYERARQTVRKSINEFSGDIKLKIKG